MLNGRPVVFLSCSERHKEQVAIPIREALAKDGIHAVIVSEAPLLPGTSSEPGAKVDAYLDASDALVALCTPDDELASGTFQCRQNIIDEVQRGQSRPNLRKRTQVFKAEQVELPSNLNFVHEGLDVDDPGAAAQRITDQLRAWQVLDRRPEPAPPPSEFPPSSADEMIAGLELGDHDEADRRALELLSRQNRRAQAAAVAELASFLEMTSSEKDDAVHRAGSLLEAVNRLDPSLVSLEVVEDLANSSEFTKRSIAATLLWDRAEVAPHEVPLGLLGRLAKPSTEDWYVQAPAMAAVKQLMLRRRSASVILQQLADSDDVDDRHAAGVALLELVGVDPVAVPRELAEQLARDPDELIAGPAKKTLSALGPRPDQWMDPRAPFGL